MTMTELNELMKTVDLEKAIKTRQALDRGETTLAKLGKDERENLEKAEMAVHAMQAQKQTFDKSTENLKQISEDFQRDLKARKVEFWFNLIQGTVGSGVVATWESMQAVAAGTKLVNVVCKTPTCTAVAAVGTSFQAGVAAGEALNTTGKIVSDFWKEHMKPAPAPKREVTMSAAPFRTEEPKAPATKRETAFVAAPAPSQEGEKSTATPGSEVKISQETVKGTPASGLSGSEKFTLPPDVISNAPSIYDVKLQPALNMPLPPAAPPPAGNAQSGNVPIDEIGVSREAVKGVPMSPASLPREPEKSSPEETARKAGVVKTLQEGVEGVADFREALQTVEKLETDVTLLGRKMAIGETPGVIGKMDAIQKKILDMSHVKGEGVARTVSGVGAVASGVKMIADVKGWAEATEKGKTEQASDKAYEATLDAGNMVANGAKFFGLKETGGAVSDAISLKEHSDRTLATMKDMGGFLSMRNPDNPAVVAMMEQKLQQRELLRKLARMYENPTPSITSPEKALGFSLAR